MSKIFIGACTVQKYAALSLYTVKKEEKRGERRGETENSSDPTQRRLFFPFRVCPAPLHRSLVSKVPTGARTSFLQPKSTHRAAARRHQLIFLFVFFAVPTLPPPPSIALSSPAPTTSASCRSGISGHCISTHRAPASPLKALPPAVRTSLT